MRSRAAGRPIPCSHSWGMTPQVRTPGAIEAEVDEVQAWVGRLLPGGGRGLRVLEVGCGPGVLAERLLRNGVELTAIDVSEEQVEEARARGVPAIVSDFLAFEAAPFDAVLFTRSLHHIVPLEAGIAKIRSLVRPGGLLVADEFAHEEIDAATAAWFWDLQAVLESCGALAPDTPRRHNHHHGHHHEGPPPADPVERWRERHVHEPPLHAAATMISGLGTAFDLRAPERGPYLHRYFSDRLGPGDGGTRLFLQIRELERLRLSQRLLVPIGLRLVATVRRPA
ncbi:MAG: class I SAM-dependent methyltransferase [Myxococcaceae bacterium]|nr:MAG: class I SAM-dependent methyltransferase [Myxococcaceae bacterium]